MTDRPPGSPAANRTADIAAYFLRNSATPSQALESKMAPPRSGNAGTASLKKTGKGLSNAPQGNGSLPNRADSPILSPEIPGADSCSSIQPANTQEQPFPECWKGIIALLPTKQDITESTATIVNTLSKEIHDLKQRIDTVDSRVSEVETSASLLESRMSDIEKAHTDYKRRLILMQLSIDDGENRSRRNNIRVRGLPEATSGSDLRATIVAIFNRLLDKPPTAELELDRVHRVQGPRGGDDLAPRDILARVHYYTIKEEILRRAWSQGPLDFDGASVQFFPDISRMTLRMRSQIRPLLEAIRTTGATYRWGHPFHLIVLKGNNSFTLRWPDQLPDLFRFLEIPGFSIPNWLDFPITFNSTRSMSPRPQRASRRQWRSRSRTTPRDNPTSPES